MIKLYMIRHGECEGSGLYIGKGSDVSLTKEGIRQIRSLSETLYTEISEQKIDHFYSSPMKRAMESTSLLADLLNIDVEPVPGLEEIDFGEWEGKSYSEIQCQSGDLLQQWINNPVKNYPPGGETLLQLVDRVVHSLPDIPALIDCEEQYNIIIVSHRGPIAALLLHFLGLDSDKFWNFKIDRGSLSKLNIYSAGQISAELNSGDFYPRFCEVDFLNRKF